MKHRRRQFFLEAQKLTGAIALSLILSSCGGEFSSDHRTNVDLGEECMSCGIGTATKVQITQAGVDFLEGNSTQITVSVTDTDGDVVIWDNSTQITFTPSSYGVITEVNTPGTGDGTYGAGSAGVGASETVTAVNGVAQITIANGIDETFEIAVTNNGGLNNPENDSITSSAISPFIRQLGDATMGANADGEERTSYNSSARDILGNIYVTGYTNGTLGGETNGGGADIFIAKFNSSGVKQWVSQLGDDTMGAAADADDVVYGITIDGSGNLFVTGSTKGTLGGETNGGLNDVFVAKFNSSGVKQWVSQLGDDTMGDASNRDDVARGIILDASGNIYVTGDTKSDLGEANGNGSSDVFVAKFNSLGVKQWVSQLGDDTMLAAAYGEDYAYGITIDGSGNLFVTGYTDGNLGENNASAGGSDVFIAKFNSLGVKQWVSQLGDDTMLAAADGEDYAYGITIDGSGNLYVTGYTNGTLGGETNGGIYDVFVAKFNSSGVKQWVSQLGGDTMGAAAIGTDFAHGITIDGSGNLYVTGWTSGTLGGEVNGGGGRDVFVAKFNSSGVKQWVSQLGDDTMGAAADGADQAYGITLDSSGNIYVTGYTNGTLGGETNGGINDVFVMKLNSSGGFD